MLAGRGVSEGWGKEGEGMEGERKGEGGRTLRRRLSSMGVLDMVEMRRMRRGKVRGNIRFYKNEMLDVRIGCEIIEVDVDSLDRQISWRQDHPRLSYTRKELPPPTIDKDPTTTSPSSTLTQHPLSPHTHNGRQRRSSRRSPSWRRIRLSRRPRR